MFTLLCWVFHLFALLLYSYCCFCFYFYTANLAFRFLMAVSLPAHKSSLCWPCHHGLTETGPAQQGRRRQIRGFFFKQSITSLKGKVDVEYAIDLKHDALHSKNPEFYKWKGPQLIANEDKCNSSALERSRNY